MDKLLIGIVLTVYPRPDGRSHWYLQRCLKSIRAQTYKNYKLFVIGDKYGRKVKGDFYYEDLPYAYERDKYTGHRLWCCGGTNAINHGIKKIVKNIYWSLFYLTIIIGVIALFIKNIIN